LGAVERNAENSTQVAVFCRLFIGTSLHAVSLAQELLGFASVRKLLSKRDAIFVGSKSSLCPQLRSNFGLRLAELALKPCPMIPFLLVSLSHYTN
jgi:hypothetical protein